MITTSVKSPIHFQVCRASSSTQLRYRDKRAYTWTKHHALTCLCRMKINQYFYCHDDIVVVLVIYIMVYVNFPGGPYSVMQHPLIPVHIMFRGEGLLLTNKITTLYIKSNNIRVIKEVISERYLNDYWKNCFNVPFLVTVCHIHCALTYHNECICICKRSSEIDYYSLRYTVLSYIEVLIYVINYCRGYEMLLPF